MFKPVLTITTLCAVLLVSACQPGTATNDADRRDETGLCAETGSGINQDALLNQNCQYLSSYRLFADPADPTQAPNGRGLPYSLTTQLFTDYASKYRFVFLPDGAKATYVDNEAFDFPVGTVLVKTFALPNDTAIRGLANERLVETRLLIHRDDGWTALPFVWRDDQTDADLEVAGDLQSVSLIHNGEQLDFTYAVPDKNKCKQCHQVDVDDGSGTLTSVFSPIGPKARLLNKPFEYADGTENQLRHWEAADILTGVPADLTQIPTVPTYTDDDVASLSTKTPAELRTMAKGYLDINCAHCHRQVGGNASNTGLHLEFWRALTVAERAKHGVCKTPIAFSDAASATHPYDVAPGDADHSLMIFRLESTEPGDRMPELGRATVHTEGVALIRAWINSIDTDVYTPCPTP